MMRKVPTLVAGILFLALSLGVLTAAEPRRNFDVQGHRGCRGLMPENSMPAFRKALELGVTTLEMDVHATADRVLVVHHDAKLNSQRCVDADGRTVRGTALRLLTREQLQGIDCGRKGNSGFPEQERVAAFIPELDEVLALSAEADYPVRFSIEIKAKDDKGLSLAETAALLVQAVRRHDLVQRTIVQSFSADALKAVYEIEPALSLAMLVRSANKYDVLLERSGARILSPKFADLREGDVRRMQERGVAVIPWTVNRPEAIRTVIEWGVDGVISDYPDRVLERLKEMESDSTEAED